jgi:hypothetical protein
MPVRGLIAAINDLCHQRRSFTCGGEAYAEAVRRRSASGEWEYARLLWCFVCCTSSLNFSHDDTTSSS